MDYRFIFPWSNEVELDDAIFPSKEESIRVSSVFGIFENELHRNLFELRVLGNSNSFDLLEFVSWVGICVYVFDPLEDKDLIWELLSHYEILSGDNRKVVLTLRNLHTDYFISLPGFGF